MGLQNGTKLLPVPASSAVDSRAALDLLDAARDLTASLAAPRAGGSERLSRAQLAADAARDLRDAAPLLDPYADGRHARLLDLAALDERGRSGLRGLNREEAVERLNLARQHEQLLTQLRAVEWVELPTPRIGHLPPPGSVVQQPSVARFLDAYAVDASEPLGPGRWLAGSWTGIPAAVIDPAPGDEIGGPNTAQLPGGKQDWHVSALAVDMSEQLADWSVGGALAVQNMLTMSVDAGLEGVILADLTTGAPTAVDIPAALAACTWPTGADLVLVAGSDAPGVQAGFAAAGQWPAPVSVLATAGATPGQAIVLASGGVHVEASATEWLTQVKPALVGMDVAAFRYGLGQVRLVGAVVTVTLPAAP